MADTCACAVYRRALSLQADGDADRAIRELIERLTAHNDEGPTWELLGILLFAKGQLDWAQAALERASMIMPLSHRAQFALATCYQKSGFRDSATTIYRHLASLADLDTRLLEPLASGLGACGELELAFHICRVASRRMPDNPEPLVGMAHYMRRLGRPADRILPIMFRVHQLEPDSAEYRISLAWLLHESGKSHDAAALLATVECADFSCVHCLIRMQNIFAITGNWSDAECCRQRLEALAAERHIGDSHSI